MALHCRKWLIRKRFLSFQILPKFRDYHFMGPIAPTHLMPLWRAGGAERILEKREEIYR
jgi:hypothetical protein